MKELVHQGGLLRFQGLAVLFERLNGYVKPIRMKRLSCLPLFGLVFVKNAIHYLLQVQRCHLLPSVNREYVVERVRARIICGLVSAEVHHGLELREEVEEHLVREVELLGPLSPLE